MVTVHEAKQLLAKRSKPLSVEFVPLAEATGRVLASDLRATLPMPLFDHAAVDGYVLGHPVGERGEFTVTGILRAGDSPPAGIPQGCAYRIFTGAAVPAKAYGVVMQEHVQTRKSAAEELLYVPPDRLVPGSHIRRKGGHFRRGALLLPKHTVLHAAGVGLLASLGMSRVKVFRKPRIGLLVTGSELRKPGTRLRAGAIYESNSSTLLAALRQSGYAVRQCLLARDREAEVMQKLGRLAQSCEVVIVSGGISVGDYDFVYPVLRRLGVKPLFYKVAQKPGKPLFAGRKGPRWFFALPGNPASALVCWYEYVLPTLDRLQGLPDPGLPVRLLPLADELVVKGDRDQFLRAFADGGAVRVWAAQDSDNLRSFAVSNALVYVPAGAVRFASGTPVEVHLLPTTPTWSLEVS